MMEQKKQDVSQFEEGTQETVAPEASSVLLKKQIKRVTLIGGLSLVGALIVGLVILLLLYFFLPEKKTDEGKKITFYPVTDENIFESAEYLGLDSGIYYCEDPNGYGVKEVITDEDRTSFPAEVRFLEIYLKSIISADHETYRSLFSEDYLKENTLPQFTQQMLYNICIYRVSEQAGEGGEVISVYRVEYMIRRNNGTFRQDVESDAIRPQFVVLSTSAEGSIRIQNVYGRTVVNG